MDRDTLNRLEKVNELKLKDDEACMILDFFKKREEGFADLENLDTASVQPMVHVIPVFSQLREDVSIKMFTRDELQKGAPATNDGYWQVPRLVE